MDAGDHRAPDHPLRDERELVGIAGERFRKRFGRLGSSEVLSGSPGSPTDHHGVPYSLTEEFVAVYRMHPLLPDEFVFRSLEDDQVIREATFPEVGVLSTRGLPRGHGRRHGRLIPWGSPTRVRSPCTTTRASCSTSSAQTA